VFQPAGAVEFTTVTGRKPDKEVLEQDCLVPVSAGLARERRDDTSSSLSPGTCVSMLDVESAAAQYALVVGGCLAKAG
jgi:hypothetical protein